MSIFAYWAFQDTMNTLDFFHVLHKSHPLQKHKSGVSALSYIQTDFEQPFISIICARANSNNFLPADLYSRTYPPICVRPFEIEFTVQIGVSRVTVLLDESGDL